MLRLVTGGSGAGPGQEVLPPPPPMKFSIVWQANLWQATDLHRAGHIFLICCFRRSLERIQERSGPLQKRSSLAREQFLLNSSAICFRSSLERIQENGGPMSA